MCARENRAFTHRAIRVLAREHGIRQWLDIGTGIPTEPNLHQVAQSVVPDAQVVYAGNDPPRPEVRRTPDAQYTPGPHHVHRGRRQPARVPAERPRTRRSAGSRPTGDAVPYGIVNRLLDALITDIYTSAGTPVQFPSRADVARFFDGLELLDPGIAVGHHSW